MSNAKDMPWRSLARWTASVLLALLPLAALQWWQPRTPGAPTRVQFELTRVAGLGTGPGALAGPAGRGRHALRASQTSAAGAAMRRSGPKRGPSAAASATPDPEPAPVNANAQLAGAPSAAAVPRPETPVPAVPAPELAAGAMQASAAALAPGVAQGVLPSTPAAGVSALLHLPPEGARQAAVPAVADAVGMDSRARSALEPMPTRAAALGSAGGPAATEGGVASARAAAVGAAGAAGAIRAAVSAPGQPVDAVADASAVNAPRDFVDAAGEGAPAVVAGDGAGLQDGAPVGGRAALDGSFRLLSMGALAYPARARRMGIAGEARLEVVIGTDGQVHRVTVLSESGAWGFGTAARRAYERARFTPPTVKGRPVRVIWHKTLRFEP